MMVFIFLLSSFPIGVFGANFIEENMQLYIIPHIISTRHDDAHLPRSPSLASTSALHFVGCFWMESSWREAFCFGEC